MPIPSEWVWQLKGRIRLANEKRPSACQADALPLPTVDTPPHCEQLKWISGVAQVMITVTCRNQPGFSHWVSLVGHLPGEANGIAERDTRDFMIDLHLFPSYDA